MRVDTVVQHSAVTMHAVYRFLAMATRLFVNFLWVAVYVQKVCEYFLRCCWWFWVCSSHSSCRRFAVCAGHVVIHRVIMWCRSHSHCNGTGSRLIAMFHQHPCPGCSTPYPVLSTRVGLTESPMVLVIGITSKYVIVTPTLSIASFWSIHQIGLEAAWLDGTIRSASNSTFFIWKEWLLENVPNAHVHTLDMLVCVVILQ